MLIRTLYLNEKKRNRDSDIEIEHSDGTYSQERGTGEAVMDHDFIKLSRGN